MMGRLGRDGPWASEGKMHTPRSFSCFLVGRGWGVEFALALCLFVSNRNYRVGCKLTFVAYVYRFVRNAGSLLPTKLCIPCK